MFNNSLRITDEALHKLPPKSHWGKKLKTKIVS